MNIVQRIAKNTLIIIVGESLSKAIALIVVFLLARYLEPKKFGIYSFILAYLSFFGIVVDLGTRRIVVREISRVQSQQEELVGSTMVLRIFLSIVAIFMVYLTLIFVPYSEETKFLTLIASLSFLFSFTSLYACPFEATLRMEYPKLVGIIGGLLKAITFWILINLHARLIHFILAGVLLAIPSWILYVFFSKNFFHPRFKIDPVKWKKLLKESWPLALTAIFSMILLRIDQIMLFSLKGEESVAYYSAAVRLTESLHIIPIAFMTSVFPLLSQFFKKSPKSLKITYELSYKYMMLVIVPLATIVMILAHPIIYLTYGEKYSPSISALVLLIWSEVWVFFETVSGEVLISTNRQKLVFIFMVTSSVLNFLLNLLLIPPYGIIGASTATLISYGIGPMMGLLFVEARPFSSAGFKSLFKPLPASVGLGVVLYYFKFMGFYSLFIGIPVFLGLLFISKGIDKKDIDLIKQVFKFKKGSILDKS